MVETIKKGYKQTEIGVIPEDWEVKTMKDICWVNQGLQIAISNRLKNPTKKSKIYITIQFLNDGKEIEYIDNYTHYVVCNYDDILMTRTGNTGIVVHDVEGVFHNNFFKINFNKELLNRKYLIYFLKDVKTQKNILEKAGTSTIPDLNHGDFYTLRIPIPPLSEQTAIAETLSNTDELITSIEKLITKKRSIKQGAMQQLLQPKEGWQIKKLGDIAELITKGTTPTSLGRNFQTSGINFIKIESLKTNGEIIPDKVAYIDVFTHHLLKRSQLKYGDILFSIAGALGRVAIVQNEVLPANTNQALAIIRITDNSEIDLKYIFIYLTSIKIQKHILNVSVQGAQANLSLLNISQLSIDLPSSKEEQTRIANILSDMDAEITALEQKLEKYKKIKQGMMQELLTGKIRLV